MLDGSSSKEENQRRPSLAADKAAGPVIRAIAIRPWAIFAKYWSAYLGTFRDPLMQIGGHVSKRDVLVPEQGTMYGNSAIVWQTGD